MITYEVASAHGRFQPLHNRHLEYLLAAKKRSRFLWVGITQYVRSNLVDVEGAGKHRASLASNPLTYYERQRLLIDALTSNNISRSEFGIIPFPIESPDILPEFLPPDIPVLTTICEPWNRVKVDTLRDVGYTVEVLWNRESKAVSGQQVRELIAAQDLSFLELVPAATARMVSELNLWERLRPYDVA